MFFRGVKPPTKECSPFWDEHMHQEALALTALIPRGIRGVHRCPFPIGWLIDRGASLALFSPG